MNLVLQALQVGVQGRDGACRVIAVGSELGEHLLDLPGHGGARVHLAAGVVVVPRTCVDAANHSTPLTLP